jgi:hypothetical protein
MLRFIFARFATSFAILVAVSQPLLAQSNHCPPPASLIAADNPAYTDARDLQEELKTSGIDVYCIFPTKFSSAFLVWENGVAHSTVEGEACFRTNFGDLGIVFVPKPQTFADLKISEHREGGGYLYTFSGMPDIWIMKQLGSGRRQYFLKSDNYIVSVTDANLRLRLEEALHVKWPVP